MNGDFEIFFGKFKGTKLDDLSSDYLLDLYHKRYEISTTINQKEIPIKLYIEEHWDSLIDDCEDSNRYLGEHNINDRMIDAFEMCDDN